MSCWRVCPDTVLVLLPSATHAEPGLQVVPLGHIIRLSYHPSGLDDILTIIGNSQMQYGSAGFSNESLASLQSSMSSMKSKFFAAPSSSCILKRFLWFNLPFFSYLTPFHHANVSCFFLSIKSIVWKRFGIFTFLLCFACFLFSEVFYCKSFINFSCVFAAFVNSSISLSFFNIISTLSNLSLFNLSVLSSSSVLTFSSFVSSYSSAGIMWSRGTLLIKLAYFMKSTFPSWSPFVWRF